VQNGCHYFWECLLSPQIAKDIHRRRNVTVSGVSAAPYVPEMRFALFFAFQLPIHLSSTSTSAHTHTHTPDSHGNLIDCTGRSVCISNGLRIEGQYLYPFSMTLPHKHTHALVISLPLPPVPHHQSRIPPTYIPHTHHILSPPSPISSPPLHDHLLSSPNPPPLLPNCYPLASLTLITSHSIFSPPPLPLPPFPTLLLCLSSSSSCPPVCISSSPSLFTAFPYLL